MQFLTPPEASKQLNTTKNGEQKGKEQKKKAG
jgi:hypothetical protein